MPNDRRLRDGLREMTRDVEPDVEQHLMQALERGRPATLVRRATVVLAYAAAILVAVAIVPAALSLIGRGDVGSGSPSPQASVVPSPACPNEDGGDCVGPLTPGAHRSISFIPPIDFVVPEGWDNPEDLPGTYTLHPNGPLTDAIFLFRDVAVLRQQCDPPLDPAVGNRAIDIADWTSANPNLVVTRRLPAFIGGLSGIQLDLAASGAYTTVCAGQDTQTYPEGTPLVPLFAGAGSGNLVWFIGGTEQMRLYLLDLPGGGNLTISVDAIRSSYDALLERSAPVIDSLVFDPVYY